MQLKQNLFIDFDSTIVDTNKAFCKYYNDFYKDCKGFIPADHTKCSEWDYTDTCHLAVNDVERIFGDKELFYRLDFFPNSYEILEKLSEKYNIIIVSIGTYNNIHLKSIWIKYCLPFIHDAVLLCKNKGVKMDKSIVNMKGGIFIDDVKTNLDSTNAGRKILFGKRFKWNKDWNGEHCLDWLEVKNKLL